MTLVAYLHNEAMPRSGDGDVGGILKPQQINQSMSEYIAVCTEPVYGKEMRQ